MRGSPLTTPFLHFISRGTFQRYSGSDRRFPDVCFILRLPRRPGRFSHGLTIGRFRIFLQRQQVRKLIFLEHKIITANLSLLTHGFKFFRDNAADNNGSLGKSLLQTAGMGVCFAQLFTQLFTQLSKRCDIL